MLDQDFVKIKNSKIPVEIEEETYWYYLGVLPPIYASGCFGLGEPYDHTNQGEVITVWCCQRGTFFYGFLGTKTEAENIYKNFMRGNL